MKYFLLTTNLKAIAIIDNREIISDWMRWNILLDYLTVFFLFDPI